MNLPVYCSLFLQVAAAFVIAAVSAKHNLKESKMLSGPLTNLQFHNDLMYIGGRNQIYALDKNLDIISSVNTCNGEGQDCKNTNKVLVVDPTGNRLITCGTGNKGICEFRPLDNLTNVQPSLRPYLTVSSDLDKPAIGMITSNEKFVIAVTFGSGIENKEGQDRDYQTYRYAISTRDISTLTAKKQLNLQIHVDVGLENYIIYYKKCLQHAGFNYFVTNQKKEVDRSSSEYVSKFIRICQNDTSEKYNSYADVVITCDGEYNIIQDAVLVNSENGSKIFMGIFTKNLDPDRNSGDSVICGVKLEELDDAIEAAKKNFFINGCNDTDNAAARYLPNQIRTPTCSNSESNFQPKDFHCETAIISTFRYVTDSKSHVKFKAMFRLHAVDGTLTSLSSTVLNAESSVILAGTSTGNIIMMNFRNMSLAKYDMMSVDSSSTVNPVRAIYQEDDDTLFVMTTDRISKFSSSNCSEFKTCEATMKGKNPLCGWCVYDNRASRKSSCSNGTDHWLSSLKGCIQLELEPKGTPANSETKQIRIVATNVPDDDDGTYKCVFTNGLKRINGTPAKRVDNIFTCNAPQVSSHTIAVLELVVEFSTGNITLAKADFLFYDCQTYMKCGECVNTTGTECGWSVEQPGCGNRESAGIKKEVDCPKLEDNIGRNFIPRDRDAQITLVGSNLPNSTGLQFWCYIPTKEGAVKDYFEASVHDKEITCSIKITSAEAAKTDVRVRVKYGTKTELSKELDDHFRNKVTVYDCEKLAGDCSHCKALNITRYECFWCSKNSKCVHENNNCDQKCPGPNITEILPTDGPTQGGTKVTIYGTELGSDYEADVEYIEVANVECKKSQISEDYGVPESGDFVKKVPKWIVCTTGHVNDKRTGTVKMRVNSKQSEGSVEFSYKKVEVTGLHPLHGPASGGTIVTVEGINLGVGNRIWTVLLGSKNCSNPKLKPNISLSVDYSGNFTIICETGSYPVWENITKITLNMDGEIPFVGKWGPNAYHVLPDPNISNIIGSMSGFLSGGTILTVIGSGMKNANKAVVKYTYRGDDVEEKCSIESPEKTLCKVPEAPKSLSGDLMTKVNETKENRKKRDTCSGCINVTIYIKLDGKQEPFALRYFRDPSINKFGSEGDILLYGSDERQLILSGESLNLVATKSDFRVTIGVANCTIIELTEDTLRCSPPSDQPAPVNPKNTFPEVNVNVGNIHVPVGYLQYEKEVDRIVMIAGAAAGGLVFFVVIIFAIGIMKYRKVGKKAKAYEKNLSDMEMEIKRVARQEFLDMHTTMSTVNKNLVEQGFPYHGYQQFACNVMFSVDYLWTEPVMTDDERLKANKGMESLESLISNKFFLVSVITTMENEKRFFIREKSNLAGNLCAVLMGRMDYLNEILKLLMTNLVQESSAKKHKTLFRRCESITEKLLSNWLSLCLYPHVKSHSGSPLYLLYMATQKTMESGPIDAVTGDAKYTLSEEKLLKKWSSSVEEDDNHDLKFEAKTLTLNVVVDNGEEIFKCKALDCDTVSQVKSKCLNQIYVNYPASQLPVGADDLALEWHEGFGGALKLRDEDNTSKREGHWVRLNTLAHYNVKDESNMALIDPHSAEINNQEDYVNLANINMDGVCDGSIDSSQPLTPHDEENPHEFEHWHLVKKEEESAKQGKSAIAELYLNRLFTTKQSLMEYMRPLFDLILDHDRCPPPTKFLYDFLDELGEKYKVETDTVHAWKSHSYAIRVWASLMKMPNTLFDVAIPSFMEENLNIISQVFIESFSLASQKFTKDSPSQKLIFHHEMNHYRDRVKEFYKNVKVDSQNSEEFRQYMAEVNRLQQQTNFNKVSALYRFYNQLKPYFEDILENLSKSKEASTLQLDRKLEQVIAIMEEED